jgi:hypothetical protein
MAEVECLCNCIGCTLGLCTSGVVDGCCKSRRNDNYIQIKEEPTNVRVSRICGKCRIILGPNVIGECPICKLEKDTTNNDMSRFKSKTKFKSKKKSKKSIQKKSIQKKSIQKKSIQKKKVQKKM